MEEPGNKVSLKKDTMQFTLHPFEIKTFRLRLKSQ
jgi:hypothetical protein